MIAIMTFVFFLLFAVSTALLVNAKINLQNAADMAAYAGAAVQARQLNHISFLNYEMRRQFKKFLYRYYIIGTKAYANEQSPGPSRIWSLSGKNDNSHFSVPSVCVTFNDQSNYCQVPELKPIVAPPTNPLDSISIALAGNLNQLENIREAQCGLSWVTNYELLTLWLFNSDPTLKNIKSQLVAGGSSTTGQQLVLETVSQLSQGLGLLPRNVLLLQRINTLQSYVNSPAGQALGFKDIQAFKVTSDPAAHERQIQAYLSAYNTLGSGGTNDTYPTDQINLTELLPGPSSAPNLLKLNEIRTGFETYYTYFHISGGNGDPFANGAQAGTCLPEAIPIRIDGIPVGVSKDSSFLTYYAVKLEATANLLLRKTMFPGLFQLRMRAYSAAQPFGSRIGPALSASDFRKNGVGATGSAIPLSFQPLGPPDLVLLKGPLSSGASGDFYEADIVKAFSSDIQVSTTTTTSPGGTGAAADRILNITNDDYYRAMLPVQTEIGNYNIINDLPLSTPPEGRMAQYFVTHPNAACPSCYAFWAPIIAPGTPADQAEVTIQQMINNSLQSVVAAGATGDAGLAAVKAAILTQVKTYLKSLDAGLGEDGEGSNVVVLRNPFVKGDGQTPLTPVQIAQAGVDWANSPATTVNTSWNTQKNPKFVSLGRLGYSVKFVSFSTLQKANGVTADGTNTWVNTDISQDSDTNDDLSVIRH